MCDLFVQCLTQKNQTDVTKWSSRGLVLTTTCAKQNEMIAIRNRKTNYGKLFYFIIIKKHQE